MMQGSKYTESDLLDGIVEFKEDKEDKDDSWCP